MSYCFVLFFCWHSVALPHLPRIPPVMTNAPFGCLQGNFIIVTFQCNCTFYPFFARSSSYCYILASFFFTYEYDIQNECAIFIHKILTKVCRKEERTNGSPSIVWKLWRVTVHFDAYWKTCRNISIGIKKRVVERHWYGGVDVAHLNALC